MADVYTRIGYIKGATGATGAQGEKGDTGDAATIQVGSVTTVPYGQTANVVNSGTEQAAVFDFTIPQGRPGQQVTEMDNLLLNSITTSAAEFPLPAVGETGKVLWGKVVKWFSDMAALVATKLNASNVVNNLTTTDSGYALDARQGKALYDQNSTQTAVASILIDGSGAKNFIFKILDGRNTFTRIPFILLVTAGGAPLYVGMGAFPELTGTLQICSVLWIAGDSSTAPTVYANYNNDDRTQLRLRIVNNISSGLGVTLYCPAGSYLNTIY